MKRKITELESRLLDYGFVLIGKDYKGKYSEQTNTYIYKKEIVYGCSVFFFKVMLDKHREKVVDYYAYNESTINKEELKDLINVFDILEKLLGVENE